MGEDARRAAWRGIDELAALVGAYCWTEHQLFAVSGALATAPVEGPLVGVAAEARVWCAAVSRRHGEVAARWAGRLPVRAGVDAPALVAPPPGRLADGFAALAAGDALAGAAVLCGAVLPGLDAVYASHLESASPVSEAPVMEVLTGARRDVEGEIRGGRTLVEAQSGAGEEHDGQNAEISRLFERAFAEMRIFPAVRPS